MLTLAAHPAPALYPEYTDYADQVWMTCVHVALGLALGLNIPAVDPDDGQR